MDKETIPKKESGKQKYSNQEAQKQFQIKHVIGRGTFGTVYFAYWKTKDQNVAVKSIAKNPKYKNRQIQILCTLHHPRIANLLMHYETYDEITNKVYSNLVMEYLQTTLFAIVKTTNSKHIKIDINICMNYAYKILQGLAYLEQKNVSHRDIKPSNILIDETTGKVQICDFGSAKQLKKGQKSITYICSRYYRAPELILGCSQYSTKIDIWSVGCIIAEMITSLPLFDGSNNVDQLAKIIRVLGPPSQADLSAMNVDTLDTNFDKVVPIGLAEKIRKGNSSCPSDFIDLITKLVVYDPNSRLSALEALNHPIFAKLHQK